MATCFICKGYLGPKESSKKYKGKRVHPICFEKMLDELESVDSEREELNKYICTLFKIDKITPLINTQIDNFKSVNGYTCLGIKATLHYFFDLKGNIITEDIKGIGIVPFVYEEARAFFKVKIKADRHNNNFQSKAEEKFLKIKKPDPSLGKIDITSL